ncbi:GrpB family protein [Aquimarina longa]|uniref:GrpB family protein n=1 Tax=Aquimarina longa TaxID=1080221 RepID=UPI000781D2B2|nr:GrpB family protein [Aquimarina longa]
MNVTHKKLEELTIEEWGELFPIKMIPSQKKWAAFFEKEKYLIEEKLTKEIAIDIQHIGSTSIPNLASKGSIDILVDIPPKYVFDTNVITLMQSIGYEYCVQGGYGPNYMIFAKGFNRQGKKEQKYFVHITPKSHTEIWDRIFFRDYLRQYPEIAKEYETLKINLTTEFSKNKRNFQQGKTEFVTKITAQAKRR